MKLQADKKVLDNNDLWLEVTSTASAAGRCRPGRFWFPGWPGRATSHNYVLLDRGGPDAALAMPFADGITIAARRTAASSRSRGVGVSLSRRAGHRPARGPRSPAGCGCTACSSRPDEGSDEFLRQRARGRWVGLVLRAARRQAAGHRRAVGRRQAGRRLGRVRPDGFLGRRGRFPQMPQRPPQRLAWRYALGCAGRFSAVARARSRPSKIGDRLALFY